MCVCVCYNEHCSKSGQHISQVLLKKKLISLLKAAPLVLQSSCPWIFVGWRPSPSQLEWWAPEWFRYLLRRMQLCPEASNIDNCLHWGASTSELAADSEDRIFPLFSNPKSKNLKLCCRHQALMHTLFFDTGKYSCQLNVSLAQIICTSNVSESDSTSAECNFLSTSLKTKNCVLRWCLRWKFCTSKSKSMHHLHTDGHNREQCN